MAVASRNGPCPCGSGQRYKDCCGRLPLDGESESGSHAAMLARLMQDALAAQRAGHAGDAARLYRRALAIAPDQADALHMLGVVLLEQGRSAEAGVLVLRALDLTDWRHPPFVHNLGLILAHAYRHQAAQDLARGQARIVPRPSQASHGSASAQQVSVIVPCYNHERYVRKALESVFAQSHRGIEIIVIDDGSLDASEAVVRATLSQSPFPHRFVRRDNRGAAATITEGIGMATAPFINILNSDDWFEPERLEAMLDAVTTTGAQWAYSNVTVVDESERELDATYSEHTRFISRITDGVPAWPTAGFPFIADNVAISSGNLFFSRALHERIGGFQDLRYNHDWEFCLRALRDSEPAYLPSRTYVYRLHGSNTISDAALGGGRAEVDRILGRYLHWAMVEKDCANPVAPTLENWGMYFLCSAIGRGMAPMFDRDTLSDLALRIGPSQARDPTVDAIVAGR